MIREATQKAAKRIDLSEAETRGAFEEIMSGRAPEADIAAFLDALRKKGETVTEITAAARVMREKSLHIDTGAAGVIDTCGTGGTGINTFNISTAAALVAAGCGARVAKHGNRTASGQCGSADVLEALGVKIDISPELVSRCINEVGIGFIFAPRFHAAMKYAVSPRKELGGKTIFNILGPLSNPAGAVYQIIGVYDAQLTETLAGVLKNLGLKRGLVVHGADGLDEITITGKTKITELKDGVVKTYYVTPGSFGVASGKLKDIEGGDSKKNAEILKSIFKGEDSPRREVVLMNASAALVACNLAGDFGDGMSMAKDAIDTGKAMDKLCKLIEMTNR